MSGRFSGPARHTAILLALAVIPLFGPSTAIASSSNPLLRGGPGQRPTHSSEANAAAPVGSHLNYYGGRVVSQIKVVQVLYGSGSYMSQVSSTASPSIATFYQGVLNSPYVDWLTEYNTNITPVGGGAGTNQTIGRGSFVGQYTITPSPANSGSAITDAKVQAELAAQISAGNLPAPTNDASGNNNTYYAIFFPHGVAIDDSCVSGGFCAYHGTIANVGGHEVYYGVHPDAQAGSGCDVGCGSNGTPFNNVTSVASHELIETVTDPEVGLASANAPPLAWYDTTNGEIGDICNAQQGTIVGSDSVTYVVQKEWSNTAGACIVSVALTPTRTPTRTSTPTFTPTRTPSLTPTRTATWTSTVTPTRTNTPIPVATPSPTFGLPLTISGGPSYSPPGGGSCAVAGSPCQSGGATVTCSGLNPNAVRFLYFGMRNDQFVDGDAETGVAPAPSSPEVFRHSTSTSNSITYIGTTTVLDSIANAYQDVSTQLLLTLTSGTASLVATGNNPADNENGHITQLWNVTSSSFTVTVNVRAQDAAFPSFGNSCPTVFNPTHTRNGIDADISHVDLGFYWEDALTPTSTVNVPTQTQTPTRTASLTATVTPTSTTSATSTPTATPTNTPTATPTSSATNSPTDTPTVGPPTDTATITPTSTPSDTPTITATNQPTATATLSPTQTSTMTATQTATNTLSTPTESPTPTTAPARCGTPLAGCKRPLAAAKAKLSLKASDFSTRATLKWKWSNGADTSGAEIGDPSSDGSSYAFCIYDSASAKIFDAAIPSGSEWNAGSGKLTYSDPTASQAGIKTLILKAGIGGKAKISVGANNGSLNFNLLQPAPFSEPVTVQLSNSNGTCWEAQYDTSVSGGTNTSVAGTYKYSAKSLAP